MADAKTLARIQKLLKLAAPGSNAPLPERESAAIEAAKLIAENDLVVREQERERPAPRRAASPRAPRPAPRQSWTPPGWERSIASHPAYCADESCRGVILPGDAVWTRTVLTPFGVEIEYLHIEAPCVSS